VNAFNSTDHAALWRWPRELNVQDIDLLQSLYSGAYYQADLLYGRSAEVVLSQGQKQGDKLSPLLFDLIFNALLLALKATGVGHRIISGLRAPARCFAADLVLVTRSAADMSRLLQVVTDFCTWSWMRIKRENSVATGFDFKTGTALPTEGILYAGAPLTGLAADEAFAYLGVRASLVGVIRSRRRQAASGSVARQQYRKKSAPCLAAERAHIFAATKDIISKVRRHQYLLGQMVPAMRMVATSRLRYSAPLVPWTDAKLDRLHRVWLQAQRAAWRLPPGYPSAPFVFPSARGGCPEAHPVVPMVQARRTLSSLWRCWMGFARPPSVGLSSSVTAAAATMSASLQKLSRTSDDRERAQLHAFSALAAGYTCQSSCQPVSPWEWQGEILAGRRCSCTCAALQDSWRHEYLKHVHWQNKSTCFARCKAVRSGLSVRPKIRLTESGTDQITILRCFLSFKTVVMSRNSIVFKIKISLPKNGHPSHARSLVPRASSCAARRRPQGRVTAWGRI
jgi:hypothetical protein